MTKALTVFRTPPYCLMTSTFQEINAGLADLGLDAEEVILTDEASYEALCLRIRRHLEDGLDFFVVDPNCKLHYTSVGRDDLRRFCYVTDAPWSQAEHIFATTQDAVVSYVDRNHALFYQDIPLAKPTVFFPHGGPRPDPVFRAERPIDVLFVGNLAVPCRMEHFEAVLAPLSPALAAAQRTALDLVLHDESDPFVALKTGLGAQGISLPQLGLREFLAHLKFLAAFAESHARWRLLTSLPQVAITHVGNIGAGVFESAPSNIRFLGPATETEVLELMRQARILLNLVEIFRGGSHERIWYGMALGAAVCSERSAFVAETLTYGRHLLAVEDALDTGGDSLAEMLARPHEIAAMAAAAREPYGLHHTWRARSRIIAQAMARR